MDNLTNIKIMTIASSIIEDMISWKNVRENNKSSANADNLGLEMAKIIKYQLKDLTPAELELVKKQIGIHNWETITTILKTVKNVSDEKELVTL